MTRHTVSVAQVYSQKFGISKIKKEIGEPGQKILNEKKKKKEKVNAHDSFVPRRLKQSRENNAQNR
jgi:hypothetical protein